MSYQKILVGIDGSKQSEMAFSKAVDIAKQNDAALYLLSVTVSYTHLTLPTT